MSNIEQDWNELVEQWNVVDDNQAGSPASKMDDQKRTEVLTNKVKQDTKLIKLETAMTVLAACAVCIYLVIEIVRGLPSEFDYVLYGVMTVLILSVAIGSVWYRKNTFKADANYTKDYLKLMLDQNAAALKVVGLGKIFSLGILALFYGIVIWAFWPSAVAGTLLADLSSVAKPVLGSAILIGVTVLSILGFYSSKKSQKALVKKRETLRSLSSDL